MLVYIVFLLIIVGVTAALYQVYETHYNINFGNDKKLSNADKSHLTTLSNDARLAVESNDWSTFDQSVSRLLGTDIDLEIARTAFSQEQESTYAIPLLRRRQRLIFKRDKANTRVRHMPGFSTRLPTIDVRGILITLIITNCFLVQLLGGMSIYTLNYEVSMTGLVWLNDPFAVMVVIYAFIFTSYVMARLDMYLHDLHQLGKLMRHRVLDDSGLNHQCT